MKTKIKICGLQSAEDIEMVNELMPEYAGFVFCESRRKVSKEKAEELIKSLDSKIKKVGVFLDQDLEEVHNIAQDCSLDILQFHGSESQQYCNSFIQEIWKSFLVEDESSLEMLENYSTEGYLLDSFVKRVAGGSGKKFNWEILENKEIPRTFILAGGLNSENVQEGIRRTKPDIVDVSSGVETNGCKDYQKIKEFIRKVRA
ncbi:MAG: phosphoribosylanthranilate isomerase [Gallicola sp.]|uniref:phosphoribosylanthranilate isomerase n=1 Tax=Gallicola sp. Sow4_E12 TaxID=3438785 RepID=UPI0017D26945|nr:phosphoribosylanthranilate isomerase [Gallicola sp.]